MDRLPPFDALIAFEAAARHASMTRAARELGVTQSAVSHRIRRLEGFMGAPLLLRQNAGLVPTAAGDALLEGLAKVIAGMADLRARCLAASEPHRLRVGVGAALADHWLVRRLPAFAGRHPDSPIELVVVENEAPERAGDLDLRILWVSVEQARATSTQRPLFREHVFPVCHPALLDTARRGEPAALLGLPLLHKATPGYRAGREWAWSSWFSELGLTAQPGEALRFASIGPSIAAALAGAGAALARTLLVHDALEEGRLVRVLPPERDRLCGKVHVVRWPARLCGDRKAGAFIDWLHAQAAETEHAARLTVPAPA